LIKEVGWFWVYSKPSRLTQPEGNISVEEFLRVMKQTDKNVTDAEVAKIISEVDIDGDGTLNFDGTTLKFHAQNRDS